ncbi:hypothetical protein T484DRAFT_1841646 [Baffinella frigidus]|nr:hypothetical protein T484DRAFT_1841646 [Cryptophyta sp. CCMP2293]
MGARRAAIERADLLERELDSLATQLDNLRPAHPPHFDKQGAPRAAELDKQGALRAAELDTYSSPQLDTRRSSELDKQRSPFPGAASASLTKLDKQGPPQLWDSFRSPECKAREAILSRSFSREFSPAGFTRG